MSDYVTYEQFGAVGDGITDDMPAIVAAHNFANEHRLPVRAKDGATYYIGKKANPATVKTDTDFGTAHFVIDDSVRPDNHCVPIFKIEGEDSFREVKIDRLDKGQKHLDLPHEGNLYVKVFDDNKKVYIRYGANANSGTEQEDCFTLDPDGNIGSLLPWQFDHVTRAYAKSCDDAPITVQNGIFTTVANNDPRELYSYYDRGIIITRSHVTLKNIKHFVINESEEHGSPYAGFFKISECADVTVDHCLLTPHKTYYWRMANGAINAYGTYDFNGNAAIGIKLLSLKQSIDIMDGRYWGLMGTNFCKDMILRDCTISRFDAHQGVINMTMTDCEFGHVKMEVIGFGQGLLERCKLHGNFFMLLRGDYGSFFKGDMTIRDCKWEILPDNKIGTVFNASNDGTHDFGYVCEMPKHILVENLEIDDSRANPDFQGVYLFNVYDPKPDVEKPYPYVHPETVTLRNVRTKSGRPFYVCPNEKLFSDVKIIVE